MTGLAELLTSADFFSATSGTTLTYRLVYLLSTECPFDLEGSPSEELQHCLDKAEKVVTTPEFLAAAEKSWGFQIVVEVVAGRRSQYVSPILECRMVYEAQWNYAIVHSQPMKNLVDQLKTKLTRDPLISIQLAIMSYDRLVDRL
jgi:microcystin degradation protein MlrC